MNQAKTTSGATVFSLSDRNPTTNEGARKPGSRNSAAKRGDTQRRALFSALTRGEDAQHILATELVPLLELCEFASMAHAALQDLSAAAGQDPALMERLDAISPGWADCTDRDTVRNIGRCMTLALAAQARAAGELKALTDEADEALPD